jgi:hypothetical protein
LPPFPAHPLRAVLLGAGVLLTLLAGSGRATVLINEFERTGGVGDRVELLNAGPDSVDLTGWTLENAGTVFVLSGIVAPGEYSTVPTFGGIVTEGGIIELYDGIIPLPQDAVPYGDQGGAPLPPTLAGWACGRSPDGANSGDPARDWYLDASQTFSAANDHLPANLGMTEVFLNEGGRSGLRAGGTCPGEFVELHNQNPFLPVDIDQWFLSDGRAVVALFGVIPAGGFFVVNDFPEDWCFEQSGVLYLFQPSGRRVDQFGVHPVVLPGPGVSYQRIPDASGPHDGYDFASSGGGVTLLVRPPTVGATNEPEGTPAGEVETLSWGQAKSRYR